MTSLKINSAVEITVAELVALKQHSRSFLFNPSRVLSQQGGDYQSNFKGRGMEFSESRPYEPGDDIRNLDWRVMARTGKAHTKLFREERERPVFFSVDFRAAMFFATRGVYKSVMASHLSSLLAWNACQHSDRVGGVIFSEQEITELKPQRGNKGVLRLIQSLVTHHTWKQSQTDHTDNQLNDVLLRLRRLVRPGSLVFFASDFRGLNEASMNQLLQLARHNELVLLFIADPVEEALPSAGRYRISNQQQDMVLDTLDKNLVTQYQSRFKRHEGNLEELAQRGRMKLLKVMTMENPVQTLQQAFAFKKL